MSDLPPAPKRKKGEKQAKATDAAPKKAADKSQADLHQKVSYLPDIHRLMPQSEMAEKGVLSSFLLATKEMGTLLTERGIKPEHFHMPAHALIYSACLELWEKTKEFDFIAICQLLEDRKQIEQAGGYHAVTGLFTYLPTPSNWKHYAEILEEKYTLREIIKVATEYAARSYDEQDDVPALLDDFEKKVLDISRSRLDAQTDYIPVKDIVMNEIAEIERVIESKGAITGMPTGFPALDKILDGLHKQEMFVIGARPSMGKTALAMNIAEKIAIDNEIRRPVGVFSLEMPTNQLVRRMITGRAKVNWSMLRNGFIQERDYPALGKAASDIAAAPIHFNDKSGINWGYIAAVTRRWVREFGVEIVIIDYLQMVRSIKSYRGSREAEVAEISSGLKSIAKENNIAIIVLAQLSRKAAERGAEGGAPRLIDLRESGAIEQDADTIGLLHRPEEYAENDDDRRELEGLAEINIAKQRNGPKGPVPLTFLKEFTRFESRAMDAEPE